MRVYEGLDLSDFIPLLDSGDTCQVKLRWSSTHKLDFIGIDTSNTPKLIQVELPLIRAFHNNLGNVYDELEFSDNVYAELYPGHSIYLGFYDDFTANEDYSYLFLSEGRYYKIQ